VIKFQEVENVSIKRTMPLLLEFVCISITSLVNWLSLLSREEGSLSLSLTVLKNNKLGSAAHAILAVYFPLVSAAAALVATSLM